MLRHRNRPPSIRDAITAVAGTQPCVAVRLGFSPPKTRRKPNLLHPGRCAHIIFENWRERQCARGAGPGPDGAYCKQHDPAAVAARREAQFAEHLRKNDIRHRPGRQLDAAKAVLKTIADGHNDARQLAATLIDRWDRI